jgi:hypothetical protein
MLIAQVNKRISCRTAKLGRSCKRMLFTIHDHQAIPSAVCPNFFSKGPHPLFWAGVQATHGDKISGMPNCLNFCVRLMVCT